MACPFCGGDSPAQRTFRREGEYWTLCYEREVVRLRDSRGLGYIAALLREPGRRITAVELTAVGWASNRARGVSAEHARLNATRAIQAAIRRVGGHNPKLAEHLAASITTGASCSYYPADTLGTPWAL